MLQLFSSLAHASHLSDHDACIRRRQYQLMQCQALLQLNHVFQPGPFLLLLQLHNGLQPDSPLL